MPTYEYECEKCGHQFEVFQSITASPLKKCPKCKAARLRRLIGAGAALLFKGSGFYTTDYRSESYKKAAESDSKPPATDSKTETKSDSKPAESKPAATESKPTAEAKPVGKPKKKSKSSD